MQSATCNKEVSSLLEIIARYSHNDGQDGDDFYHYPESTSLICPLPRPNEHVTADNVLEALPFLSIYIRAD